MISAGTIGMPLHPGKVPSFLSERMGRMGDAIIESILDNYGKSEVLTRMSDPNWFQAFGAVTGMHWNSSGVTAVLLGALKRRMNKKAHETGLYILGGKGKAAYSTEKQIGRIADTLSLPGPELSKSSRLTKRVDNNAVQDGFDLYQQYFLLSNEGEWTAMTQGMNKKTRRARRYHWHSPTVRSFGSEPHSGIMGLEDQQVLNLVDPEAETLRNNMVELTKEKPAEIVKAMRSSDLPDRHDVREDDINMSRLASVLDLAYNRDIENFEELIDLHGVGPRTLKALAMASEVIHGDATRFDETVEMLQNSVDKSKMGDQDKSSALKRLHKMAVNGETKGSPIDFLQDLIDQEWNHAESSGGKTFMGDVVKGLTRKITDIQNPVLYGNKADD